MTKGDELLACPFCGGEAQMYQNGAHAYPWSVKSFHQSECFLMHSNVNRHRSYATEAAAITAWNTRSQK